MVARGHLIGRDEERDRLEEQLRLALGGDGALVLVSGEAGVGKTRLLDELAGSTDAPVLRGAASHDTTPAYGPVVAALRSHLRADPDALDDCGPLGEHLRLAAAGARPGARQRRQRRRCARRCGARSWRSPRSAAR